MKNNCTLTICLFLSFLVCSSCGEGKAKADKPAEVQAIHTMLDKATAWQIRNFTYLPDSIKGNHHDYGLNAWTNAVFLLGLSEWADISAEGESYMKWLMETGESVHWQVAANFKEYPKYQMYHADELCIAQFYLKMYGKYKIPRMIQSAQERADWVMANPPDSSMNYRNKQSWTWCDALFMAPPVYAQLTAITGDKRYTGFMHRQFLRTYNHLFEKEKNLFFRDDSYFGKQEENGEKVFWGRGNGWVLAGLARILTFLPANAESRPFYEKLFKELAAKLKELQNEDGFWHASLLDPQSYPAPETSATALITYGLAYGVNNDLLGKKYLPCIRKAWKSLCSVVDENGKIGWVQPIGADPKKVTADMSAVYGTGAILLAGIEILTLINNQ